MLKQGKSVLALVAATIALAGLVGSATANRLSISNRNIRATWTTAEFETFFTRTRCPVTLEGTLHSNTIRKVVGALIGHITRATINSPGCANGGATVLQASLPWHIEYRSFTGRLPDITSVVVAMIGVSFQVRQDDFTCLWVSTVTQPVLGTFNRNTANGQLLDLQLGGEITTVLPCVIEEFVRVTLYGRSATLTLLGNTSPLFVTLI